MTSAEETKDVEFPSRFKSDYLEMSDGGKLRYSYYHPENPKGHVLLYPGMNTLVLSWIKILNMLIEENFAIDYVESREKFTSILPKENMVTKERMLEDCVEVINLLNLQDKEYIALGSSLGSTTLIINMARHDIKPKHAVLVGPSAEFDIPLKIRFALPFINHWTFDKLGRDLLKKATLKQYTNADADPAQARKYSLALDLANPIKLKKCIGVWRGYKIWDQLENIDGNTSICHLIGASEDILHPDHLTRRIAEGIENSVFVDLKTNSAAHDRPLIDYILKLN